jgi:hypothetical protein
MSAQTYSLLAQVPELLAMGVEVVRISPQPQAMARSSPPSTPPERRSQSNPTQRLGQRRPGRRLLVRRRRHRAAPAGSSRNGKDPFMSQGFSIPRFKLPSAGFAIGARCRNGRTRWPGDGAQRRRQGACCPKTAWHCSKDAAFVVEVLDAGGQACFTYRDGLFRPLWKAPRAGARPVVPRQPVGFSAVARRQEDPDTLFFNRELSIVGDTELGLVIKNMLDAVELATATQPARFSLLACCADGADLWLPRPACRVPGRHCPPGASWSKGSPAHSAPACSGDWFSSFR